MRFKVAFQGWVVTSEGRLPRRDELEQHLAVVMAELRSLGFKDAVINSDSQLGNVEVEVPVDADDWDEAQELGSSVIRSAIHGAGGATPNWSIDWCRVTIEKELTAA